MALEDWNSRISKYVLYRSTEQHSQDCDRYPYEAIPRRVFIDTNVINLLVKHSTWVFEREPIPVNTDPILARDAEALMHVFHVGSRAYWDLIGSSKTIQELSRTKDKTLRDELLEYGVGFVDPNDQDRAFAADFGRRMIDAPFASALPDPADRELIGHAIGFGCDAFCTCDRATIISKRNQLRQIPLRVLTPVEWWFHVKPWAALWS